MCRVNYVAVPIYRQMYRIGVVVVLSISHISSLYRGHVIRGAYPWDRTMKPQYAMRKYNNIIS
jgi:hypothetical protein